MIKKIVRDQMFLSLKATLATKKDLDVANDLSDTINVHDNCIGMAANMICVKKNIIVVAAGPFQFVMINPVITKKTGPFQTEEGCLSLLGDPRPCKRYKSIKVQWQTAEFQTRIKTFTGWPAQIIQHEIDHCNGILI